MRTLAGWLIRTRLRKSLLIAATLIVCLTVWLRFGPLDAALLAEAVSESTVVVDRNGVPLYEALSVGGTRTRRLTADQLPPLLVAATLAAEDRRYWRHPGVDVVAIARAAKTNLAERRVVEGASTITQQVAKLLLEKRSPGRSRRWAGKLEEALLALRLEGHLSKHEILALYLNLAAYGNRLEGAERASRAYFGVTSSMLTPAQAAFLAGLPQRPSTFNPYRNPKTASARQRTILRRMEMSGALAPDRAAQARAEHLVLSRAQASFAAPHFVEMVLKQFGDARPNRVTTTLDSVLQAEVSGIISSHRRVLQRHGANNVAVVVLDNASGGWLAWEGSGEYFDSDHGGTINGPTTARQPGSALKPFTYALAFEHGATPATVLADVPSHFPTAQTGVVYTPRNYDGRFRGPLLARQALAGSENIPAVILASRVGVPALLRFFGRAGFSTFDKTASYYGLGLTLGNAEVRLDEMVTAYAAFARGGVWMPSTAVLETNTNRRPVHRLVSERTAFWITDILADNDAREFVFGRGSSLEFPFPVAVKTGTSQAYHDNWTIGYTPRVTVGVWVGNFDRTPLRNSSGVSGAGPIFHAVMLAAVARAGGMGDDAAAVGLPPRDVHQQEICALSGMVAQTWCPTRKREWVAIEHDSKACDWHRQAASEVEVDLPAEYRDWLNSSSRGGGAAAPPHALAQSGAGLKARHYARADTSAAAAQFRIASPPDGSTYLIDPTLRREFQTLPLRVVSATPGDIVWMINGEEVGAGDAGHAVTWPLRPGHHRISARDAQGRVAEAMVTVR